MFRRDMVAKLFEVIDRMDHKDRVAFISRYYDKTLLDVESICDVSVDDVAFAEKLLTKTDCDVSVQAKQLLNKMGSIDLENVYRIYYQ